jgi:hypothetical protein
VKNGLPDIEHADAWLRSTGRPGLYDAQVAGRVLLFTDYKVVPYYYVYGQNSLYILILSVSDTNHPIDPSGNRVYRHWLASFKVY